MLGLHIQIVATRCLISLRKAGTYMAVTMDAVAIMMAAACMHQHFVIGMTFIVLAANMACFYVALDAEKIQLNAIK